MTALATLDAPAFQRAIEVLSGRQLQVLGDLLEGLEKRGVVCDAVALAEEIGRLDRNALADLQAAPLPLPDDDQDEDTEAAKASGGRLYELTAVIGLQIPDADRVYSAELRRAERLIADGVSPGRAWMRIRRDFDGGRNEMVQATETTGRRRARRSSRRD